MDAGLSRRPGATDQPGGAAGDADRRKFDVSAAVDHVGRRHAQPGNPVFVEELERDGNQTEAGDVLEVERIGDARARRPCREHEVVFDALVVRANDDVDAVAVPAAIDGEAERTELILESRHNALAAVMTDSARDYVSSVSDSISPSIWDFAAACFIAS
jgi:hypothetical protein